MTTPLALPPLRRYLRHGTLPQLAAFEAVVRLGSATRAAQALCVAQPTISGHLKKLGEALDVRLFELRGKRLVPTAAALALLEATHEVSAALARCEQTLGLPARLGPRAAPGPSTPPSATAELERDHRPQLVGQHRLDEEVEVVLERFLVVAGHAAAGDDDRRHARGRSARAAGRSRRRRSRRCRAGSRR